MRILVVEDDEVLREGLDAGLSLEGHTVDLVETCLDIRTLQRRRWHSCLLC